MSDLESIMQVIDAKKTTVTEGEKSLKENRESLPVSAKRAKLGLVKRAKHDLQELYMQYRGILQTSSLFMIVSGNKKDTENFVNLAEKEFGCYTVDAESLFKELLDQVPPRLYENQTASSALFDFFSAKFEDRAMEIDIIGYPHLTFESKYKKPLKNKEEALELLKRAFNDKVGGEVVGLDAIERVTLKAVNEGFSGKHCPIILHTTDPLLALEIEKGIKRSITENTFVIALGSKGNKNVSDVAFTKIKKVDVESVKKSLVKIKKSLV